MKKIFWLICFSSFLPACKKYLDTKSDKEKTVPVSLQDAQAILDNYQLMNQVHPVLPAQSDDDFYLTETYYNSVSELNQGVYRWNKDVAGNNDWRAVYNIAVAANTALETVEKIKPMAVDSNQWKGCKGAALFLRAYSFLEAVLIFADPYDKLTVTHKNGIPLRLTSDLNEPIFRSTLQQTYDRIIDDFKQAVLLLPITNPPVSRPSKPAAYAALARTFLMMQEYELAGKYADSCLRLYSTLIDYNTLNTSSSTPFIRFNPEVIFQATMGTTSILGVNNMRVDSSLYLSYTDNDLRKLLYFKSNGNGTYGFKGSYDGNTDTKHFSGLATDEMFLIRAEAAARASDKDSAIADLNRLLKSRWETGQYIPYTAIDANDALHKILTERRKELVIRGLRWYDLRRLNKEPQFAKTLIRKIGNQTYQLLPNSSHYTFYIPFDVIAISGMEQNIR